MHSPLFPQMCLRLVGKMISMIICEKQLNWLKSRLRRWNGLSLKFIRIAKLKTNVLFSALSLEETW